MGKIQIIENLFYNIFLYSFLLPLISFFFFKKIKSDSSCVLIIIYGIIFFLLNLFFSDFEKKASLLKLYYTLYTFLEYVLFTAIMYSKVKSIAFRRLIIAASIGFVAFQVIHFTTMRIAVLDSIPIGIETILIFIYIIFYFYEQFKVPSGNFIYHNYVFWIAFGIMIYLGGSFFFNIMADYMYSRISPYWDLTYIGDIVKNALFLYGLILFKMNYKGNSNNKKTSVPYLDMDFT